MEQIPLTQGKAALVDSEDYVRLMVHKWFAWCHHGSYYAHTNIYVGNKRTVRRMAHEVLNIPQGTIVIVDHKDRNGLNNQKDNLRIVDRSLSAYNRNKFCTNTTGYRGVHIEHNRYKARIQKDNLRYSLGCYSSAEAAALAYDRAAIGLYGNNALLNFPKERMRT